MAKIGRPRAEVVITDSERTELGRLTKRAHVNRAVVFRARVVLACADDSTDKAVARRLAGLYDEPRVGAPRTVSDDAVEAVIGTHNYIRHGTLDLFAALNVATGEVLSRCTPQHRAQDFVAFLRDIRASRRAWRSTSCWITSPRIRRRPCSAGCSGIRASTSTSRRPTRPG